MHPHHRRQPWQTFPFWFLMFSGLTATVAWKLNMLPFGKQAQHQAEGDSPELDQEFDLASDPPAPPADSVAAVAQLDAPVEPPPYRAKTELQTAEVRTAMAEPTSTPYVARNRHRPPNPFGPSRVEFLPAPEQAESAGPAPAVEVIARIVAPEPPAEFSDDWDQTPAMAAHPLGKKSEAEHPESVVSDEITLTAGVDQGDSPSVVPSSFEGTDRKPHVASPEPPAADWSGELTQPTDQVQEVDFSQIDALTDAGEDIEANFLLSTMYWKQPELRAQLRSRIDEVSARIFFQPKPHYLEPHVVQAGDQLQSIAKDYHVPWQYLAKLNRTKPDRIRPNQELKVIQGPFSAVVDLSDYELTVHAHGHFVARFDVGVGKDDASPIGKFKIEEKLIDPTYYGPDGVVPNDDPANPLGERWLAIGDGFGIHGTNDEDSIGRSESKGCIRLRNRDVADVYDMLSVGSEIVIRK